MSDTTTDPVQLLLRSVSSGHPQEFVVTGIRMRYYHTCHRELWFDAAGVELDRSNAAIRRGTYVDEHSYEESTQAVHYGPIAPDLLDDGRIVEVKPSSTMAEASKMQLAYYLWYLKHVCGDEREGVLAYPTERTRESVTLTPELETKIEAAIRGIYEVVESDTAPVLEKKPYCDSCAYQEFCWSGYNE
jgi:CRISPR-associated exonuclease Cas4